METSPARTRNRTKLNMINPEEIGADLRINIFWEWFMIAFLTFAELHQLCRALASRVSPAVSRAMGAVGSCAGPEEAPKHDQLRVHRQLYPMYLVKACCPGEWDWDGEVMVDFSSDVPWRMED